jgi:VWFA-related protein
MDQRQNCIFRWGRLNRSSLVLFLAGLAILTSRPHHLGTGSQEAVRPQKPFQYQVRVTLKLIQVIVTDKQGNPVTDLRKDEFALYDNGEERKLTEFEKHDLRVPAGEDLAVEERVIATPLPGKSPLLGRKIFLLLDFAYADPQFARKIGEAALHFVDKNLLPTDEVGVLSYSGIQRLKIHEFLTTDHKKVRKIVESFGLHSFVGSVEDFVERYNREVGAGGFREAREDSTLTLGFPPSRPGTGETVSVAPAGKQTAGRLNARFFIESLAVLAQALRYLPGQKNLILFSGGIPGSLFYNIESGDPNGDLRSNFENLCKGLATANIAVYAIKADALSPVPENLTGAATLTRMASATGGKYFSNIFNYAETLEKIQTLTGAYYVLGYPVDEKWDGRYHTIKVQVSRPGCDVRAQAGYFNPKPFSEFSALEKRIQLVDLALAEKPLSQTPVHFPMAALPQSNEPKDNLWLAAEIPHEKIAEISGKKVEIVCLVFDAKDDIVQLLRTEEDFSGAGRQFSYLVSWLSVAPGPYKCRIVMRNMETGRAAVAAAKVVFPKMNAAGIQLYPPLFLVPEKGAHYLKGLAPKSRTGKAEPSLALLPFDTAQYAPVLEKVLRCGSTSWAVVRCAAANIAEPETKLSVALLDRMTGDKISVPLTIISQKDEKGTKTYFVRLEIPDVEPDEYTFVLAAEETKSGATSEVSGSFAIERTGQMIKAPEN